MPKYNKNVFRINFYKRIVKRNKLNINKFVNDPNIIFQWSK